MSHSDSSKPKDQETGLRAHWPLVVAVVLAALLAAGLVTIGVWRGLDSGFRLEFAKAGLNLIVLAVLGAGVTAAVQWRAGQREQRWRLAAEEREETRRVQAEDREAKRRVEAEDREEARRVETERREEARRVEAERREERRRRETEDRAQERQSLAHTLEAQRQDSAYALGVLRDIISNYNRLKAARRAMRAVGLDKREQTVVTTTQAEEFVQQMQVLGEVQLAFEAVARELDTRLDTDGSEIARSLGEPSSLGYQIAIRRLASYVEALVREWEKHGREVAAGDDPDAILSRTRLQAFLKSSSSDTTMEFRRNAAEPLRALQLFFGQRFLVPLLREAPTSSAGAPSRSPDGA